MIFYTIKRELFPSTKTTKKTTLCIVLDLVSPFLHSASHPLQLPPANSDPLSMEMRPVRRAAPSILWLAIWGVTLWAGVGTPAYGAGFLSCVQGRLDELIEEQALQRSALKELDDAGLLGEEDPWVTLKLRHESWSVHPVAYRAIGEAALVAGVKPEKLAEHLSRLSINQRREFVDGVFEKIGKIAAIADIPDEAIRKRRTDALLKMLKIDEASFIEFVAQWRFFAQSQPAEAKLWLGEMLGIPRYGTEAVEQTPKRLWMFLGLRRERAPLAKAGEIPQARKALPAASADDSAPSEVSASEPTGTQALARQSQISPGDGLALRTPNVSEAERFKKLGSGVRSFLKSGRKTYLKEVKKLEAQRRNALAAGDAEQARALEYQLLSHRAQWEIEVEAAKQAFTEQKSRVWDIEDNRGPTPEADAENIFKKYHDVQWGLSRTSEKLAEIEEQLAKSPDSAKIRSELETLASEARELQIRRRKLDHELNFLGKDPRHFMLRQGGCVLLPASTLLTSLSIFLLGSVAELDLPSLAAYSGLAAFSALTARGGWLLKESFKEFRSEQKHSKAIKAHAEATRKALDRQLQTRQHELPPCAVKALKK